MNNSFVYCIPTRENDRDVLDLYIVHKNNSIYLFRQKFRKSTLQHYKNKCVLIDTIDYKKAHSDTAIKNVIKRIKMYIPYIEKEYEIPIRKNQHNFTFIP